MITPRLLRIIIMKGEHDRGRTDPCAKHIDGRTEPVRTGIPFTQGCFVQNLVDKGPVFRNYLPLEKGCLLYTSDAADDMQCVDLGGRRIIKKG